MPERLSDVPRLPPAPRVFGRASMVEEIVQSLLSDPPPPVPILGGPGIGKTTVSVAALHDPRVASRFGSRRFFVRCEPAKSADALTGEIARTIGFDLGPDLENRLFARLGEAPAILVLDNAETPWEADREATERLLTDLSGIAGLALLASVRSNQRPLGPAWRETITVTPLPIDSGKEAFLAIAGAKHKADPLLDTLVKALDGLPLAITLLAHFAEPEPNLSGVWDSWQRKRTELLSRPGGSTRLTNAAVSFELSIAGPRMTPMARRLLAIAALLPDGIAHTDFNDLLPDQATEAARVLRSVGLAHDEQGRLRLLAPVREYIAASYPPEEADRERAVGHYNGFARTFGPRIGYEGGAEAIVRLAADLANIEAMIRLGLEASDPSKVIAAAVNLRNFWAFSGFGTSGLLEEVAAIARNWENFEGLANCILSLGDIALARSDHDAARARYEEAQPLYRQVGNVLGEANCIKSLGDIALERSDHDAARARYEEALPLYRRIGNALGEANCIKSLGDIALERSDHDAARALYEEALPLYRRIGNALGEANCIQRLGDIALQRSDHDVARAQFETALKLYERVQEPYSIGCAHERLARIAKNDTARRYHVAAAREAWRSIDRNDLVQKLDIEFSVTA
jgi:tetratricopeptide (TPR) repeat protein